MNQAASIRRWNSEALLTLGRSYQTAAVLTAAAELDVFTLNSAVGRNHERRETHKKEPIPSDCLAGEGFPWRVKSPDDEIPFVFVSFRVFRGFHCAF
jgi:hypothetical protein